MDGKEDGQAKNRASSGHISSCPTNLITHSDHPHPCWDPLVCRTLLLFATQSAEDGAQIPPTVCVPVVCTL